MKMTNDLNFEPEKWHACKKDNWQECTEGVNCYSYILNRPDYYWSVPGMGFAHASGQKYIDSFKSHFKDFSLEDFRKSLIEGAMRDGLILLKEPTEKDGYYLVTLFFPKNNQDFHWYRKDSDGSWSHKDGWEPARNKDDDGNLTYDPQTAALPLYPVLGGFFLVPWSGVALKQNFPIDK
jgi:hypothetical protein